MKLLSEQSPAEREKDSRMAELMASIRENGPSTYERTAKSKIDSMAQEPWDFVRDMSDTGEERIEMLRSAAEVLRRDLSSVVRQIPDPELSDLTEALIEQAEDLIKRAKVLTDAAELRALQQEKGADLLMVQAACKLQMAGWISYILDDFIVRETL